MFTRSFSQWIKKSIGIMTGPRNARRRARRLQSTRFCKLRLEGLEDRAAPSANPTVQSIDRTAPLGPTTSASGVDYTVTFSESVTGVDASDFQLALTGGVTATTPVVVAGSGAVYTVTINGIAGSGTLGLNLVDDNSIRDLDGNPLV